MNIEVTGSVNGRRIDLRIYIPDYNLPWYEDTKARRREAETKEMQARAERMKSGHSVKALELPMRVRNVLFQNDIVTIEEARTLAVSLRHLHNLGQAGKTIIEEAIAKWDAKQQTNDQGQV